MRGWWRGFCDNAERRVQSTECLEREGTKGSEDAKREDAKSAKNCLLLASWRYGYKRQEGGEEKGLAL